MNNRIKIFLASSTVELCDDRIKIGDFFNQLNDLYFDNGIHFDLIKCEDFDKAVAIGGKQSQLDDAIRDSELCFFVFFKKVGDATKHELEIAIENFKKTKTKPQIVTYFKYIGDFDEVSNDVKEIADMLDSELGHYYNVYSNVDTLKLGILMQIKLMKLDYVSTEFRDGKAFTKNAEIANLDNIPIFSKNDNLQNLKKEFRQLEEKYAKLRLKIADDPNNDELFSELYDISKTKNEVEEQIKTSEETILSLIEKMYTDVTSGELSQRQQKAYRLYEQGKYDEALKVLDWREILDEIKQNEALADIGIQRIQTNVNELNQSIDVLKAKGKNNETVLEIEEKYDEIVRLSDKYNLDKSELIGYANFLFEQNNYNKAKSIAEKVRYYLENPDINSNKKQLAYTYSTLGYINHSLNLFEEAKEMFFMAFESFKASESTEESTKANLQALFNNMAITYTNLNEFEKAEEYYIKSIDLIKNIDLKDDEYWLDLSAGYSNLAMLYRDTKQYEKALSQLLNALETSENIKEKNGEYAFACGRYCYNIAVVLTDTDENDKALKYAQKAYSKIGKLYLNNTAAYEPLLADIMHLLGEIYESLKQSEKAEHYYYSHILIMQRLAKKVPNVFKEELAQSCASLATFYIDGKMHQKAITPLKTALKIFQEIDGEKPSFRIMYGYGNLGQCYYELAILNETEINENLVKREYDIRFLKAAEKIWLKSISLAEKLDEPQIKSIFISYSAHCLIRLYDILGDVENKNKYENIKTEILKSQNTNSQKNKKDDKNRFISFNDLENIISQTFKLKTENINFNEVQDLIDSELSNDTEKTYDDFSTDLLNDDFDDISVFSNNEIRYKAAIRDHQQFIDAGVVERFPMLAATYADLAEFYLKNNKLEQAESNYINSIELYRQLSKENADEYEYKLAEKLFNLADMYCKQSLDIDVDAIAAEEVESFDGDVNIDPTIAVKALPYALEAYNIFMSREYFEQEVWDGVKLKSLPSYLEKVNDVDIAERATKMTGEFKKLHNIKIMQCLLMLEMCYSITGDADNSEKYAALSKDLSKLFIDG